MENKTICVKLSKNAIEEFSFWDHVYDPDLWVSIIDVLSKLGGVVTAFIATIAAYFAYKQLQLSRKQNTANLYKEYLELCFEHPKFARGMDKPIIENCSDYSQYCWFVSRMLFLFEQALLESASDPQWVDTIKSQLKMHKSHLKRSSSLKRGEWEKELDDIISNVISS